MPESGASQDARRQPERTIRKERTGATDVEGHRRELIMRPGSDPWEATRATSLEANSSVRYDIQSGSTALHGQAKSQHRRSRHGVQQVVLVPDGGSGSNEEELIHPELYKQMAAFNSNSCFRGRASARAVEMSSHTTPTNYRSISVPLARATHTPSYNLRRKAAPNVYRP